MQLLMQKKRQEDVDEPIFLGGIDKTNKRGKNLYDSLFILKI